MGTHVAHLFEHLMFNGSEINDDYFKVLQKVGATDLNGTTNVDRTNYFHNVPATSWTTIGSMDDLKAASLGDVREWFKAYYGPRMQSWSWPAT